MKQPKIKSITEAFSMQPTTLEVVENPCDFDPDNSIKEIKLESDPYLNIDEFVYVGYNFKGEKKFHYLANSVNVHYF